MCIESQTAQIAESDPSPEVRVRVCMSRVESELESNKIGTRVRLESESPSPIIIKDHSRQVVTLNLGFPAGVYIANAIAALGPPIIYKHNNYNVFNLPEMI
jgi:hypothetical protein